MSTSTTIDSKAILQSFAPTEAQVEVWLLSQLSDQANCSFNECSSLRFHGQLNVDVMQTALESVVGRNAMLRATFGRDGHTVRIHEQIEFSYSFSDWSSLSAEQQKEAHQQAVAEEGTTPFDLENGPLLRVRIQKLSEQEHVLIFTAHHIVMDGWSLWVFSRDLGHFYAAGLAGNEPNLPPADSYRSYADAMAIFHASDEGFTAEAFWLDKFNDSIPVLDMPTDRPRPALKTFDGSRCDLTIDAELVQQLRKAGAKSGCSLFNTMLAGFHAFLARITNQCDIAVGIPTAGQASMDHQNLIGHCVNSMPFRSHVDIDQSMLEFVKQIRTDMLDALEHQRYTFGSMLRKLAPPRDPSRPPIFSVMFNVDPDINTDELGFADLRVELAVEPRAFENFEWFVNGVIAADGSVELQCQYNTNLFDHETVLSYLQSYEALLRSFVADPAAKIRQLPILSIEQKQRQLVDWNNTETEYPTDATVYSEFERQAIETPDAIVVSHRDTSLTFSELDRRANQFARFLSQQGVSPGDLVGICVERSKEMLAIVLGIWKTGAGYVPLDPAYPDDRLKYMCDQSQLKLVVTQTSLADRVTAFGKSIIDFQAEHEAINQLETTSSEHKGSVSDTAYVIYTSGSTGKPKGVQVPHGPVVNFLYSMQRQPGFGSSDRILAVTTLSFDISILELYLPLVTGGQIVIADNESIADGPALIELIEHEQITLLQATPATWRLLVSSGWKGVKNLKALCGGEPMPTDLVGPLLERCGELWNMYGPTETTVWSSLYRITDADATILIGKPIANTQIYLLDANQQPVPRGVPGELYIGGAGVTHGYLHQNELTNDRFIDNPFFNPFAEYANHRLYKTGDLARHQADGNIEFLRRNDKQVKVRGYRIELGEIEQNLLGHQSVAQAVVIVREDTPGDARLVAYYIPKSNQLITVSDLRKHLRQSLPHYMIPQHFVELESFPQTENGKVNHKQLPAPDGVTASETEFVAPETEAEILMASIWQELIGVEAIGVNDNFFNVGGHSLLAMQVIQRVETETGVRLSPQDFLMGTLENLAGKLPSNEAEDFHSWTDEDEESLEREKNEGLVGKLKSIWK